jgi:hypothetical protein
MVDLDQFDDLPPLTSGDILDALCGLNDMVIQFHLINRYQFKNLLNNLTKKNETKLIH